MTLFLSVCAPRLFGVRPTALSSPLNIGGAVSGLPSAGGPCASCSAAHPTGLAVPLSSFSHLPCSATSSKAVARTAAQLAPASPVELPSSKRWVLSQPLSRKEAHRKQRRAAQPHQQDIWPALGALWQLRPLEVCFRQSNDHCARSLPMNHYSNSKNVLNMWESNQLSALKQAAKYPPKAMPCCVTASVVALSRAALQASWRALALPEALARAGRAENASGHRHCRLHRPGRERVVDACILAPQESGNEKQVCTCLRKQLGGGGVFLVQSTDV